MVVKSKQKANLKNHHDPEELRAENTGEERQKDFPGGPAIRTPLQEVLVGTTIPQAEVTEEPEETWTKYLLRQDKRKTNQI